MYAHPKNLIAIENCANCGHDMTVQRKRLTPTGQEYLTSVKQSLDRLEQ